MFAGLSILICVILPNSRYRFAGLRIPSPPQGLSQEASGRLMLKDQTLCASSSQSAKVAAVALALSACGLANVARADDMRALGNIGDANKSVGVIAHYDIHAETKTLDLVAATPRTSTISPNVERQLAVQLVHQICAEGAVSASWTVRMFMPGESSPAATCRFGGRRAPAPPAQ
jgi:hypothetical protein